MRHLPGAVRICLGSKWVEFGRGRMTGSKSRNKSRNKYQPYRPRRKSRSALPQKVIGGLALTWIALAGAWTLCTALSWLGGDQAEAMQEGPAPRSNPAPSMFESRFYLGHGSASLTAAAAAAPQWYDPVKLAALPSPIPITQDAPASPQEHALALHTSPYAPRSADIRSGRQSNAPRGGGDQQTQTVTTATAEPTIFERIFGKRPTSVFEKLYGPPGRVALAYAAPEAAAADSGPSITPAGRYDRQTAVYDISAKAVYLPDGTTLEAHSGLGDRLDNPNSAPESHRGVTPPTIYDLHMREAPFHGVRAIRLIPEDDSKVFGRNGLLAHTFMLGPNGDSNGCVSFKDYDAFLRAYENHEITRLAVVASVD
jgi:hypothetical protein